MYAIRSYYELKNQGVDIPVLLGGAALTKGFVNDYCRPIYDGPIFYCRDAFDGVVSMQRIEKGDTENTLLNADLIDDEDSIRITSYNVCYTKLLR